MRLLVDECCPKVVVARLRADGHDVRYAAETEKSADDRNILASAVEERRIVGTEDFDLGALIIRDGLPSYGAIVLFMPDSAPRERAERLGALLSGRGLSFEGMVTIVEIRRVRQRRISS